MKRRLNHAPLGFPELALAHHQTVAKQQSNAFDGLALLVVPRVVTQNVLRVPRITDYVHRSAIDMGFVDVAVALELFA